MCFSKKKREAKKLAKQQKKRSREIGEAQKGRGKESRKK